MLKRIGEHTRQTFLSRGVILIPKTERIVDSIMPFFPSGVKVISGYMDASAQYWKVNYHWEYLLFMIGKALRASPSEECKASLAALETRLRSNSPAPSAGYFTPRRRTRIGFPRDVSTPARARERWAILRDCKKRFRSVSMEHRIWLKPSVAVAVCWHYAVAPVAPPGRSKHGSGYALDLSGDSRTIKTVCKQLGASLVFDEKSHVHVEFAKGATEPGSSPSSSDDIFADAQKLLNRGVGSTDFQKSVKEGVEKMKPDLEKRFTRYMEGDQFFDDLNELYENDEDFVAEADRIAALA